MKVCYKGRILQLFLTVPLFFPLHRTFWGDHRCEISGPLVFTNSLSNFLHNCKIVTLLLLSECSLDLPFKTSQPCTVGRLHMHQNQMFIFLLDHFHQSLNVFYCLAK